MAQSRREENLSFQDYTPRLSHFTRGKMDEKKIELYWKQLCNQEKTSKSRNKALMDDFERIEHQSAVLEAQTKKLKTLRDRYEGYINTMYPRWLDELKHYKEQIDRDTVPSQGTHLGDEMKANRRHLNNVRFTSPTYMEHEQDSLQTSNYTQCTGYPDHSYYDQSFIPPYGTPRFRTLDWDHYHRDPSFDYYHVDSVPSTRTPKSNFAYQPRPDYMRFSTPYNPAHSGPFDTTNSFGQSFIMHPSPGYDRGQRHPNMGAPMRYTSPKDIRQPNMGPPMRSAAPSRLVNEHDRIPNSRQEMLRSENSADVSYQEPGLTAGFYDQVGPEASHNDHVNKLPQPQLNGVRSPSSETGSPYRDLPEKPLEHTSHPQEKTKNHSNATPEKLSIDQEHQQFSSPYSSPSDVEKPKSHEDLVSGNSLGSPLDLSDLQTREPDSNIPERHKNRSNSPRSRGLFDDKVEMNSAAKSPVENVKENSQKDNGIDDLLGVISDGLSLSSGDISEGEGSLDEDCIAGQQTDIPQADPPKTLEPVKQSTNVTVEENAPSNEADMEQHIDNKPVSKRTVESVQSKEEISAISHDQKPSLSVQVFLTLLKVVDADIEVSFSPETLYHAPVCSQTMKDDIIMCAEKGGNLETYDPSSVSMVLLEELPKLTRVSPSHGLIKNEDLESVINQPMKLRESIEPSLMSLWNGLLSHMVRLVEHNVMAVDEVVKLFTVLLLASNPPNLNKFQVVLADLIKDSINERTEGIPADEELHLNKSLDHLSLTSEESSTLGSTPPQSPKHDDLPNDNSVATPVSLERTLSYEDDFEEEDVPLTETAAYRKMMSSTKSNASDTDNHLESAKYQNDDSEGDDDLERTLARSISPPLVSPRQRSPIATKPTEQKKSGRQKPKLSIFGGGGDSLGLSYGSEDLGADESGKLSSSWKSEKSDITDKTETPPSSPDLDTGYVPTAIEQKKQPVTIPKTARKPEFWNHSDTESEVDLQLSTGVVEEDDDFDFYG